MAIHTKETTGLVITKKKNRIGLDCHGVHLPVSNINIQGEKVTFEILARFIDLESITKE